MFEEIKEEEENCTSSLEEVSGSLDRLMSRLTSQSNQRRGLRGQPEKLE